MRFFIFAFLIPCCFLHPDDPQKGSFFFLADPLYWKANGDGLAFAVERDAGSLSKVENLHFDWDFGFQVALGYRIPHDAWEFSLGLTHIHTNAAGSASVGGGHVLLPIWIDEGAADLFSPNQARAHWRLHLGLLDFLLCRKWHPSSRLNLNPLVGIRAAWIRQKYNLAYDERDRHEDVRMKNKYWGMGPAIGLDSSWEIFDHWSLFADVLFSLLYGEFYVHQNHKGDGNLGIHNLFKSGASTLDGSLGLQWKWERGKTLKRLTVEAGWDWVVLFGQNQWMHFVSESAQGIFMSNQGELSLQGVHLGARLDF